MKIRYNIATGKKVNYRKFGITVAVVLIIAIAFFYVGISSIAASKERFRKEKEELSSYKEEIERINEKKGEYRQNIEKIKGKWGSQIAFCKQTINEKLFPYLEQLNKIEQLLPAGVYLLKINLSSSNKNRVAFSIASHSEAKLTETYEAFMDQKLAIRSEVMGQKDGLWKASLAIQIGSSQKTPPPPAPKKPRIKPKDEVMDELKSLQR